LVNVIALDIYFYIVSIKFIQDIQTRLSRFFVLLPNIEVITTKFDNIYLSAMKTPILRGIQDFYAYLQSAEAKGMLTAFLYFL